MDFVCGAGSVTRVKIFLIPIALLWTVLTLGADYFAVNGIRQQIRAERFAATQGSITDNGIEITSGSKGGRNYRARLSYAYEVNGRRYVADRYRYGGYPASEEYAQTLSRRYPVGAAVTVFYDPTDAANAVLKPGLEGVDVLTLLFLVPFNLALAAGASWLLRGAPQRADTKITPISAAATAVFVAWFPIILGLVLFTGFNPTLPVSIGAGTALAAIGLGVGVSVMLSQARLGSAAS